MHFNYFTFVLIFWLIFCEIDFNECNDYSDYVYYDEPGFRYIETPRYHRRKATSFASSELDQKPVQKSDQISEQKSEQKPEQKPGQGKRIKKGTRRVITRVPSGIKFGIVETDSGQLSQFTNSFDAGVGAAQNIKKVGGNKALQEFAKGVASVAASSHDDEIKSFSSLRNQVDYYDQDDRQNQLDQFLYRKNGRDGGYME